MGVEQIVVAVVEDAQIDRERINSTREQSALSSGEAGSAVEFWFWALEVKLGLPLVERLSRYDTTAAIAICGRLVLPAQTGAGVGLVKKLERCARDGSGEFLDDGDADQSLRPRQLSECR